MSVFSRRHKAFTLSEALIVLAILGIISAMLIPKLLSNTGNQTATATVKDIFVNTGELFMRRQNDASMPDVVWGNEAATFQAYMLNHMTGQRCTATEGCLIKFPTGARVISVTDTSVTPSGAGSAVNAVVITLSAPRVSQNFKVVVAPNPADPTGPATRYSSMFGMTGNEEVPDLEAMLKTDS